jgi:glycosyltransferase involved in cell wall biosynthesis
LKNLSKLKPMTANKTVNKQSNTGVPHPKILVAMPAYNEEKYIGNLVLKAGQYADEVFVIDDGSTDGTAEIARLAGATVVRHQKNRGKGVAVQRILSEAKKSKADILVLLDADSQHNPDEIPQLIKPIRDGYDLAIGSREEQSDKTPRYRRIGQKVLLFFTKFLCRERITDSESGFKAFSLKAVNELKLKESGFAIEAEMIASATDKHLKLIQVPISNIYTKDGSTLNPIRHGLGVLVRILVMISERRPLFFFGIGGIILTIIGILVGVRVLWVLSVDGVIQFGTAMISALFLIIGIFSIFTGIILHALGRKS